MSEIDIRGSVSVWIVDLKEMRQPEAIGALCKRYLDKLTGVARRKLQRSVCGLCDGEDVALEAIEAMHRAAVDGKLTRVNNRGQLWVWLVTVVSARAAEVCRSETRLKRGGKTRKRVPLEEIESPAVPVEFELMLAEEQERLLGLLRNDRLRDIARWHLSGDSLDEISKRLRVLPRTVARKLAVIRGTWSQEPGGDQ
ncbi:MAG TPA: ECF-type sigma factor [Planctomycetaceae bacterium]|jgi:DNA-directed RNA polymerase specialized sigma24 family protein